MSRPPRIRDFPDDEELWEDLEDEFIPDPQELVTSGPYGPPFAYLQAARLTLDSGLIRPTKLLTRTAARLALKVAHAEGEDPSPEEAAELEPVAAWQQDVDEPEALLELMAAVSGFVERRLKMPEDR